MRWCECVCVCVLVWNANIQNLSNRTVMLLYTYKLTKIQTQNTNNNAIQMRCKRTEPEHGVKPTVANRIKDTETSGLLLKHPYIKEKEISQELCSTWGKEKQKPDGCIALKYALLRGICYMFVTYCNIQTVKTHNIRTGYLDFRVTWLRPQLGAVPSSGAPSAEHRVAFFSHGWS